MRDYSDMKTTELKEAAGLIWVETFSRNIALLRRRDP